MLKNSVLATIGSGEKNYIEDVFSTYLYTGNGSTQTITNNIDLSTKGGLVWIKGRGVDNHMLFDTVQGADKRLNSNTTAAVFTGTDMLTSFGASGFSLGADTDSGAVNASGDNYVSWTFRKQPKFFDVVTYTGTGANRTIAHNLGSVPGCIIVKRTDTTGDWQVYHRSLANTQYMVLNTTAAVATGATRWNSTTPTSTEFSLGTDATVNANAGTYVAYLFANDAGGFGLTGTDNVISCGSFDNAGADLSVSLGYEPQWLLIKKSDSTGSWGLFDNMRGIVSKSTVASNNDATLFANTSAAEASADWVGVTSTGFDFKGSNFGGGTFIYIAIRRGPMKVPTDATKVFSPNTYNTATAGTAVTTGFPVDSQFSAIRTGSATVATVYDRLRGVYTLTGADGSGSYLRTSATTAETAGATQTRYWNLTGFQVANYWTGNSVISWNFRRAPNFFDQVCYLGNDTARTISHNLGAVPELMIIKDRTVGRNWYVYSASVGNTQYLTLNQNVVPSTDSTIWNNTTPTSSVFTLGTGSGVNASTENYVAYLFATCPGVSKVGSYTGNGTSQTINCGFTGGSRFVLIKRTSSAEDWYVWDSARGIVPGNDPSLRLNVTNAESTTYDSVDTDSSGFIVNQDAAENINVNGSTYIFLAIA